MRKSSAPDTSRCLKTRKLSSLRGLDFRLLPSPGAPRRWKSGCGRPGTPKHGLEGQVVLPAPHIHGLWHLWGALRGLGGGFVLEPSPRGLAERAARRRPRAPGPTLLLFGCDIWVILGYIILYYISAAPSASSHLIHR